MIHQWVHSKKVKNYDILLAAVIAIRQLAEKQSQLREGIARQRRIFDFAPFHSARKDISLKLVFRVDSSI